MRRVGFGHFILGSIFLPITCSWQKRQHQLTVLSGSVFLGGKTFLEEKAMSQHVLFVEESKPSQMGCLSWRESHRQAFRQLTCPSPVNQDFIKLPPSEKEMLISAVLGNGDILIESCQLPGVTLSPEKFLSEASGVWFVTELCFKAVFPPCENSGRSLWDLADPPCLAAVCVLSAPSHVYSSSQLHHLHCLHFGALGWCYPVMTSWRQAVEFLFLFSGIIRSFINDLIFIESLSF